MTRRTEHAIAAGLLAAAASVAACRGGAPAPERSPVPVPAATFPTSSAEASRPAAAAVARDTTPGGRPRRGYTGADVRFMQGMIGHHAQALAMADLLASRTARDDMRLLGERITVSQRDEIGMMQQWLRARGETAPDPAAGHAMAGHDMSGHDMAAMAGGAAAMPGMATPEEMARLAAARGAEFDRLFLELMIRHHEGAITMVRTLFASPGAGQESELYRFASDVDADQRAEIARMRALLGARPPR